MKRSMRCCRHFECRGPSKENLPQLLLAFPTCTCSWCWPGSSSYLDVTSPAVREWWAEQFALDKYKVSSFAHA